MKNPWFVVKRYGIGASPKGWRGWLFTLAFVVVMVLAGIWVSRMGNRVAAALAFPLLILGFVVVAMMTSDGKAWRWRWGDDD